MLDQVSDAGDCAKGLRTANAGWAAACAMRTAWLCFARRLTRSRGTSSNPPFIAGVHPLRPRAALMLTSARARPRAAWQHAAHVLLLLFAFALCGSTHGLFLCVTRARLARLAACAVTRHVPCRYGAAARQPPCTRWPQGSPRRRWWCACEWGASTEPARMHCSGGHGGRTRHHSCGGVLLLAAGC